MLPKFLSRTVFLLTLVGLQPCDAQPIRSLDQPIERRPLDWWEPERRLTRDIAESRTSINFARAIAADDRGGVHVVWRDDSGIDSAIRYKRSPDGGVSWGPPIYLTAAPGPIDSGNPSIAVWDQSVHVAWWDTQTGKPQIHTKRSLDGGLKWGADIQVTDSPVGAGFCSLAVSGESVHIVYDEHQDGTAEVYYTRSLDGGQSWSQSVRLSAVPDNSYTPTIAVWQSNVYVAWTDTRHGGAVMEMEEEYFRRSTDNGETWDNELRLTFDPPDNPANSWAPSLATDGSNVWMTWFDARAGGAPNDFDIYIKHSDDFGAASSWSDDERLTSSGAPSQRPVIARHESMLCIVWWDWRDGNEEIYFLLSPDLGESWTRSKRLTTDPGASTYPSIAAGRSGMHVVWTDDRDGNGEVYYRRFRGTPVRVENGLIAFSRSVNDKTQIFTAAADGTGEEQLTFTGNNIYPAWSKEGTRLAFTSDRSGADEIWSMSADGSDLVQLSRGSPGMCFVPAWSYDGTRIAFAYEHPSVGHPEVWVMNSDGTDPTRLTFTTPNPDGFTWSLHPTWEPGDEKIYYASTETGTTQIWGMYAHGEGNEQKSNGAGPEAPDANVPEFSRAGTLTFWAGYEGQYGEVFTMTADGNNGAQVTETPDPLSSDNPSWAPDGSQILFDSNRGGSADLWSIQPNGEGLMFIVPDVIGQVSWQPVFPSHQ